MDGATWIGAEARKIRLGRKANDMQFMRAIRSSQALFERRAVVREERQYCSRLISIERGNAVRWNPRLHDNLDWPRHIRRP